MGLEYEIIFDLTDINKDKNVVLSKYSLDEGATFVDMNGEDIIKGEINLTGTQSAMSELEKTTVRTYWLWYEDITNPTFDSTNTKIKASVVVKQKV